jgi:hypothetical protein
MKKALALFLAVTSIFSFASCAGGKNTSDTSVTTATTAATDAPDNPSADTKEEASVIANTAVENFFKNDSMNAVISAKLKMSSAGITSESSATKELFASSLGTSPVFRTVSSTTNGGKTETSEIYFKDGAYYVSKYGFDAKIPQSDEADEEYGWKKTFEMFLAEIKEDNYVTYFKINSDGSYEIKAEAAEGDVMFAEYIDGIKSSLGAYDEGSVQYGNPTEKITLKIDKDGTLKEYSANIAMTISASDGTNIQTITVEAETKAELKSVGGTVTVEAPEKSLDAFVPTTVKNFAYTFASMAYEEFAKKPDIEASMQSYLAMQAGMIQMELEMSGTLQVNNLYSTTPLIRERAVVTIGDSITKTDIYCCDGYYYIRTYGDSINTHEKLSMEEYDERYGENSRELFRFIDKNSFSDWNITSDTATGERAIYFEIPRARFSHTYYEHLETYKEIIVGESTVTGIHVESPEILLTLDKEGKVKSFEISYLLDLTVVQDGTEITISSYIYDKTVIKSTENVIVETMTNLDDYKSPAETA